MKQKPFYDMIDSIVSAIRLYDQSDDHLRHGADSDCVRCAVVKALPSYAQNQIEEWRRRAIRARA